MNARLFLGTGREDLALRELTTEADDEAYFDAVSANRDHIGAFGGRMGRIAGFKSVEDVTRDRIRCKEQVGMTSLGGWLREGIDSERLIGNIVYFPSAAGLEIGGWIDARYARQGLARTALQVVVTHTLEINPEVTVKVKPDNERSVRLVESVGFRCAGSIENGYVLYRVGQKTTF